MIKSKWVVSILFFILTLFSISKTSHGAWSRKNQSSKGVAIKLKVSSFNIRWYGLGGNFDGDTSEEDRDSDLKKFISKVLSNSDVVVFQEIVDVPRFKKNVIASLFKCHTYDHPTSKHQHVVLCHKPKYGFKKVSDDKNIIYEDVAINRSKSRPAVYGVLTYRKKSVLNVFGLHLKAFPHKSDVRLEQVKKLAQRVKTLPNELPILIMGDFNTHISKTTGLKEDDVILIDRAFKKLKAGLKRVKNSSFTYRSEDNQLVLDHIWTSTELKQLSTPEVYKACIEENADIGKYNEDISDHCPVSVDFQIKY